MSCADHATPDHTDTDTDTDDPPQASRATSTGASRPGAPKQASAGSPSMTPGTPARPCSALEVHPRMAMRVLRHAQIDVTMNVYTEVSDAKTLQALKRLGEQLDS
jgi:hypothetical protein